MLVEKSFKRLCQIRSVEMMVWVRMCVYIFCFDEITLPVLISCESIFLCKEGEKEEEKREYGGDIKYKLILGVVQICICDDYVCVCVCICVSSCCCCCTAARHLPLAYHHQ